jgi:hypothetical protein
MRLTPSKVNLLAYPLIRLFDVIRNHEEIVPIAQLAEDHHRRYGKPLRIAVDEADWRFNNLTQAQVYAIRDNKCWSYKGLCELTHASFGYGLPRTGKDHVL